MACNNDTDCTMPYHDCQCHQFKLLLLPYAAMIDGACSEWQLTMQEGQQNCTVTFLKSIPDSHPLISKALFNSAL